MPSAQKRFMAFKIFSFPVVFKSLISPIRGAIYSRAREASTRKRKASLHFHVGGGPNGERLWVWGEVEPHAGSALGLTAGNGHVPWNAVSKQQRRALGQRAIP